MPSKQSAKSGGNKSGGGGGGHNNHSNGKGQKSGAGSTGSAAASGAPTPSAAPTVTAPSFDSLPHATSGERLKGIEVGSSIPALMSELGVLLQQTPGSAGAGGSGSGGGPARGQNGGLLFEDLDFAAGAGGAGADSASVLFGDDAGRRIDMYPPGALERLTQVFHQQQRQALASAAAAAAAAASAASPKGSTRGSVSVEVVDSEEGEDDDKEHGEAGSDGASRSSRAATGHTTPAPASANSGGGTAAAGEFDPYSAAGRRHNLEEMFEMMQRSIGNFARGAGAGGGAAALAGDLGLDPSTYSDPLTQLELFRAMMVATSKNRGGGGLDGKGEDGESRSRAGQRGTAAAGGGAANATAGTAAAAAAGGGGGGRVPGAMDLPPNNPFQSFLDVLGPQLIGQVRMQHRAAAGKATAAAAAAGGAAGGKDGKDGGIDAVTLSSAAVLAGMRDGVVNPTGAANLSDLQKRVEQVRVLSSSTLEELAADEVSDTTSGNLRDLLLGEGEAALAGASPEPELASAKVGYCLTEAAAVAVSMLWSYLGSQQKEAPLLLGWNREAAQSQFNMLLFRLRQELAGHSAANLAEIARSFGGGCVSADVEDIYRAVNGVGVLLFFTSKPLPLLEKTCAELGISLSDSANADSNVMAELIAEKLAAFLYPMRDGKLSFAQLGFVPRMQVHEHAPGNYTCTVDNASNMGRMQRERLLSNRFSCNKIKWRAALVNNKGELTFMVWHRYSTPLSVHLLVRTSEPKKKKARSGGNGKDSAAAEGAAEAAEGKDASANEELRANSALFLERQVTAAPGEMIGFTEDFIALTVALNSPTTLQHGYRTYNKADDRLVFQFSLQLSNLDGTLLEGGAAAGQAKSVGKQTPQQQQQQQQAEEVEPSINGSIAVDPKEEAEAELKAAIDAFCATETAARAVVVETAHLEYRHIQNDECRGAHQARRRTEERERKALLAKVGPSAELIREVEKLTQAVQAAQQQIGKLNKERAKDDKESEKMAEKVAQQHAELSEVLAALQAGEEELAKVEEEAKAAERRIQEKRARLARKEAKKAEQSQWTALKRVLEPATSSTHHDTLAINDFGSFLQSSSSSAMPAQPQTLAMSSGGGVFGSSGSGGGGGGGGGGAGLSVFGTDPYSARQGTATPPSGLGNTTPVFSTQPKMGMMGPLGGGNMNAGAGAIGGGVGGPGQQQQQQQHPLLSGNTNATTATNSSSNNNNNNNGGGGVASSTASTHHGMVSPMVPPSPGVASNASAAALGSRNSPGPAVVASLGSPGMPLGSSAMAGHPGSATPSATAGGRGSVSPANAMMMGGPAGGPSSGSNSGGGGNGGVMGSGGLAFGLAPSLFSTNPVSHHASHSGHAGGMGGGHPMGSAGSPGNSLYTSLDINAQPFSPSPPPGSPGAASNSLHSHMGSMAMGGNANASNNNNNNAGGGGGGFAFTVTAGAGMHPGLGGGSSSPLYTAAAPGFTSGHDLGGHSPSPFSTTPMSANGNGLYMVGGAGGNGGGNGMHGGANELAQHASMFPPQPHSSGEMLSFSTGLQWRN